MPTKALLQPNLVLAADVPEPVCFIAPSAHPLAGQEAVTLEELPRQEFLLTERGMSYRDALDQCLAARGLAIHPYLELGSAALLCQMVEQGMGLSFLPEYIVRPALAAGRLARLNVPDCTVVKYLHKGGRISGGAKLAGTILNIKPILQSDEEGKIVLRSKVRGKSRAIEELANLYAQFCNDPTQTIGLAHADCPADMLRLHSLLREKGHTGEILTVCYEPVTGSHVGPGALALFFMGEAWR